MSNYISEITALNFKGRAINRSLARLTAIIGPNRTGKSSYLDAIRLAVLGYLPDLAKKGQAIMELASASTMQVTLELADVKTNQPAGSISAALIRDSKGSVSFERTPHEYASPCMDASAYFGMTEGQRIDYIFRHVPLPSDCTVDGIIAELHKITFGEEHSEALEKAKQEGITLARQGFEEHAGRTVNDALVLLTGKDSKLAEECLEAGRKVKDSAGATRILTELKLRETECSTEHLGELNATLKAKQERKGELERRLGELNGKREAAEYVAERKAELEAIIATPVTEEPLPEMPVRPEELSTIKREWQEIMDAHDGIPDHTEALENANKQAFLTANVAVAERMAHNRATADLESAQKELVEIEEMTCCPKCQGRGKGWKAKLLTSAKKEVATIQGRLVQLDKAVAAAAKKALEAKDEVDRISGEIKRKADLHKAAQNLALKADEIRTAFAEAERAAIRQREEVMRRNEDKVKARGDARKELETLQQVVAPSEEDIAAVKEELFDVTDEITELDTKRAAAEKLRNDLERAQQAVAIYDEARAKEKALKAIGLALKEQKSGIVTRAFAGLLERTRNLVPFRLDYHNGEIGYWNGPTFVTHRVFSGSEKLITYAAIGAALAAQSPLRVLLLDELANLTTEMRADLFHALYGAVDEGMIDQVIAIIPTDDPAEEAKALDGHWKVITTVRNEA